MKIMAPHIIQIIILLLFVVWGIGAGYVWIIKPLKQSKLVKNWIRVPCTIESSELKCEVAGDGPGYHPEIRYTYEYNNIPYISSRFSFYVVTTSL